MRRGLTLLAATIALVTLLLQLTPVQAGMPRHEEHVKAYKVSDIEVIEAVIREVLEDPSVGDEEVRRVLEEMLDALSLHDYERLNPLVSELGNRLSTAALAGSHVAWSDDSRNLLAYLSSLRFEACELGVYVSEDSEAYAEMATLLAPPKPLSKVSVEDVMSALEILSEALEGRNPSLAAKTRRVVMLMEYGRYEEAAREYQEVMLKVAKEVIEEPSLANVTVSAAGKGGRRTVRLVEILSLLPGSIDASGVIRGGTCLALSLLKVLRERLGHSPVSGFKPLKGQGVPVLRLNVALPQPTSLSPLSLEPWHVAVAFVVVLVALSVKGLRGVRLPSARLKPVGVLDRVYLRLALATRSTPRDRVIALYRVMLRLLARRGLGRRAWETHREHLSRLKGLKAYSLVKLVALLYERALFDYRPVSEEDVRIGVRAVEELIGVLT